MMPTSKRYFSPASAVNARRKFQRLSANEQTEPLGVSEQCEHRSQQCTSHNNAAAAQEPNLAGDDTKHISTASVEGKRLAVSVPQATPAAAPGADVSEFGALEKNGRSNTATSKVTFEPLSAVPSSSPLHTDQLGSSNPSCLLTSVPSLSPITCPLRSALHRIFGYSDFRPGQEEAIRSVLKKKDVMLIMPTGGGKTLTYVLPGQMLPGIVLIVSPLLALMNDQVMRIRKLGFGAAAFNSTLTNKERQDIIDALIGQSMCNAQEKPPPEIERQGELQLRQQKIQDQDEEKQQLGQDKKLRNKVKPLGNQAAQHKQQQGTERIKYLFVTPEQISLHSFHVLLQQLTHSKDNIGVSLVGVDEAHCISQWGDGFRTKYRRLGLLRELLPGVPVLACTATASSTIREDIISTLKLHHPVNIQLSFNRPNITYEVRPKWCCGAFAGDVGGTERGSSWSWSTSTKRGKEDEDDLALENLVTEIEKRKDQTGIVYCLKKVTCDEVSSTLKMRGIAAASYHAALHDSQRVGIQAAWLKGDIKVLAATVAFGMGVDNPNVRFVFHFFLPKSIEAFYQESGRCGRDGKPARSILFYSARDFNTLEFILNQQIEKVLENRKNKKKQLQYKKQTQQHSQNRITQHEQQYEHEERVLSQARREMDQLQEVRQFCETQSCRRRFLLEHFGERVPTDSGPCKSEDKTGPEYAGKASGKSCSRRGVQIASMDTQKDVKSLPSGKISDEVPIGGCCDVCSGIRRPPSADELHPDGYGFRFRKGLRFNNEYVDDCALTPLEFETSGNPREEPPRRNNWGNFGDNKKGRVVYKQQQMQQQMRQKQIAAVRPGGLSDVLTKLEEMEEQESKDTGNGSNEGGGSHAFFARYGRAPENWKSGDGSGKSSGGPYKISRSSNNNSANSQSVSSWGRTRSTYTIRSNDSSTTKYNSTRYESSICIKKPSVNYGCSNNYSKIREISDTTNPRNTTLHNASTAGTHNIARKPRRLGVGLSKNVNSKT